MRNREVVEFLIYPKVFLSLAIPYKGQYFLRIRVYEKKIMNGKIVHAFPKQGQTNDFKLTKNNQPCKVNISEKDVYFDTERLEYDESREFKTYIEIELIRKPDPNFVPEGCISISKEEIEPDSICKEIYIVNDFKRLDMFERVYFQHYDFYCAIDLYIASVNFGKVIRNHKFQLTEFSINPDQFKKSQSSNGKITLSLPDFITSINLQVEEYTELRKIAIKYQQMIKGKKSFLFQTTENLFSEVLIYKKRISKTFLTENTLVKIMRKGFLNKLFLNFFKEVSLKFKDMKLINQNLRYLFSKLPGLIKDIPVVAFKNLIMESMMKKFELKKRFLLKKVAQNFLYNQSSHYIKALTPRHSFENTSQFISDEVLRSSQTFKENRKIEKKEFINVRREQFLKYSQVISIKECNFPMLLIEKSVNNFSMESKEEVFEVEKHSNSEMSSNYGSGVNLIVLIHGYQGSHHDLKKIKNYLEHFTPHMKILSITSIEKSITEGIEFLAEKIAAEIEFYISNSYEPISKINFIGFSLGGVLARASLKHLYKYRNMMNLLITLASPHLGVSESENTWVNLGLWYLSKVDKVQNIKELNFQSVTEKDSFLMKLSKEEEIGWFNKVVIVSCSEDEFVPHYSARIMGETKNEEINSMAFNIMSRIKSYDRIEVWFDVEKKSSIDRMIGRKSHIEFIENYSFLEMLCKIYEKEL